MEENEKQKLIEELKVLLQKNVAEVKEEVEALKTQFYRSERTEEEESAFKALLEEYRSRRAEIAAQQEAEEAKNLEKKIAIIATMKNIVESEGADVMDNLQRVRELQAEWKATGPVPVTKAQEIRKQYNQYQEQYYDLVKINIELRDLDFKKNLEVKTKLVEAAEALKDHPSIVEANRALQQLHEEWAETGPVARELREEIWNRFKEASTFINKKHQAYFDDLHKKEQENLEKKQALIEELKTLRFDELKSNKAWDSMTEKVQTIQNEWRTIGFAPKKQNQAIYEEYRSLCDAFFKAKTEYYKQVRDVFAENMKKKRALIEKAEALKDSQDWRETTDAIVALQAEWKTIGPVARKHSDEMWKQFTEACDAFFTAKREASKAEHEAYLARKAEAAKEVKAAVEAEAKRIAKMKPADMWEAIGSKWKVTKK